MNANLWHWVKSRIRKPIMISTLKWIPHPIKSARSRFTEILLITVRTSQPSISQKKRVPEDLQSEKRLQAVSHLLISAQTWKGLPQRAKLKPRKSKNLYTESLRLKLRFQLSQFSLWNPDKLLKKLILRNKWISRVEQKRLIILGYTIIQKSTRVIVKRSKKWWKLK